MRAVVCESYGEPNTLTVRRVPDPTPGPGETVVEVHAAAANYPDTLTVADRYQVRVPLPFTPGSEFAGVVREVGPGVDAVVVGDRVQGTASTGAFAERIAVPAAALAPIPSGLDMAHAAALSVTYRTGYHALTTIGGMRHGDWVVVLGAAGGVGSACVDLAARLGGRVIAAASTPERARSCLALGASATIAYGDEDLKKRIKQITGNGADLVIDPVGGRYAEQAIRAGRWGGRYVCVGFADGEIPRIPLNLVLLKGVILRGFEIRTLAEHAPDAVATGDREIARLVSEGMRPLVSEVFALADAPRALERLHLRGARGKLVIDPRR